MKQRFQMKKNVGRLAVLGVLFSLSGFALLKGLPDSKNEGDVLGQILIQTGKYCEKLKNSILDFVCVEKIKEEIDYGRDHEDYRSKMFRSMGGMMSETKRAKISSTKTNRYLYDYQLIKKGLQTYEKRILIEENGKSVHEENARLKLETFWYRFVVLGPFGLLSQELQEQHDYKIIRVEKYQGKRALVIESVPKNPDIANHLFGRIWIDEADAAILKIEWDVKSAGNYGKIEEFAKRINAVPRITMVSEYGVEKNGIRFPSRYVVREAYHGKSGGIFVRSEVTVTYEDYKFFTVETEVKYKTSLNPLEELPVDRRRIHPT